MLFQFWVSWYEVALPLYFIIEPLNKLVEVQFLFWHFAFAQRNKDLFAWKQEVL